MWKDFSVTYLKNNKATGISIAVAAFIAALFISGLCSLFYNMWVDNTNRVLREEGDWQARFATQLSSSELQTIRNAANVTDAFIIEDKTVVYFDDPATIYTDMPEIAELIHRDERLIEYHSSLLAQEFVFPEGEDPPLLWGIYAAVLVLMCLSLILIIKSAFQFSMNPRIHQLGILQSVGATPRQIRHVLLQEAFVLTLGPILLGTLCGIGLCVGFLAYANSLSAQLQLTAAHFEYHIFIFIVTIVCAFGTVLFSAWLPARKLSRVTPLEALKGDVDHQPKKMREFRWMSLIFGTEGELSRKSLYARRKAFRTATICLSVSFFTVSLFLVFMTVSEISTEDTYWKKYQDAWDIMIEMENPEDLNRELLEKLSTIDGVESLTAYQKNFAYTPIAPAEMSPAVNGVGGYEAINSEGKKLSDERYMIEVPIVALDNKSYQAYVESLTGESSEPAQNSVVVVNTIWDSVNSRYRHETYLPFLTETEQMALKLYSDQEGANEAGEVIVSAYTEKPPNLREEYKNYTLVQVMSQDTYTRLAQNLPNTDKTTTISVRATADQKIAAIEDQCIALLGNHMDYTIENRPEQAAVNTQIYAGYRSILTGICALLACIGIANVFANTLGYTTQRKREFARIQSLGVTPGGITKMLCAETFIIGVKPILISIPFTLLFTIFVLDYTSIDFSVFMAEAPIFPIVIFALAIIAAVGLSYYLGGRQLKNHTIAETLKDDTMY